MRLEGFNEFKKEESLFENYNAEFSPPEANNSPVDLYEVTRRKIIASIGTRHWATEGAAMKEVDLLMRDLNPRLKEIIMNDVKHYGGITGLTDISNIEVVDNETNGYTIKIEMDWR